MSSTRETGSTCRRFPSRPCARMILAELWAVRILREMQLFFFFSYEGLRLLLPQTASVIFLYRPPPGKAVVAPSYKPYVNALPLPTATPPLDSTCDNVIKPCIAPLTVGYSDPSTNSTPPACAWTIPSIRKLMSFGRYNHAPSSDSIRSVGRRRSRQCEDRHCHHRRGRHVRAYQGERFPCKLEPSHW